MKIDIARLKNNLLSLSEFGYKEGKGITRAAFTPEYNQGKEFTRNLMIESGLQVWEDSLGNLFGRLGGASDKPTIMVGSHLDTVPQGGIFDGALGVLGGIEAVKTMVEAGYSNDHPVEICAFTAEEGSSLGGTLGSRAVAGKVQLSESEREGLDQLGLSETAITSANRYQELVNSKCYLELHVEQGPSLWTDKLDIGIVSAVAGIRRYQITVTGEANHAGTTPMDLRKDALLTGSELILKINKVVQEIGGNLVGTVGDIKVTPGATNIIPGQVSFPLELRDNDPKALDKAVSRIQELLTEQSSDGCNCTISELITKKEVSLNTDVQENIEAACRDLGYSYRYMISGAGHDATIMSQLMPTGMIFIPSVNGISHSPEEWSEWEDIEKGVNTLLHSIIKLDSNKSSAINI